MYIILYGTLTDGFQAVGPFADFEEASEACETIEATLGWPQAWIMSMDTGADYLKGK